MSIDLTRDVPRSPFDELDGFPWLPRMIDKTRALVAGRPGDYSPFPGPGDRGFLKHFGVDAEGFRKQVEAGASDEAIAEWVAAHAKNGTDEAKSAFRREQLGPHSNPVFKLITKILGWMGREAIAEHSPGVVWWRLNSVARVLAAEEGHPLP